METDGVASSRGRWECSAGARNTAGWYGRAAKELAPFTWTLKVGGEREALCSGCPGCPLLLRT